MMDVFTIDVNLARLYNLWGVPDQSGVGETLRTLCDIARQPLRGVSYLDLSFPDDGKGQGVLRVVLYPETRLCLGVLHWLAVYEARAALRTLGLGDSIRVEWDTL